MASLQFPDSIILNAMKNGTCFSRRGLLSVGVLSLAILVYPIIGQNHIIQHSVESSNVKVCDNVEFFCQLNVSDAEVWWTLNDVNVTDDSNFTVIQDPDKVTLWKLKILCVQLVHRGNYTCHVAVPDSPSMHYSDGLHLEVTESTEPLKMVHQSPPMILGKLGSQLQLNCTISGSPLPQGFVWKKNRERMESRDGLVTISNRVEEGTLLISYLVISNLTESYLGKYRCIASTQANFVYADITVVSKAYQKPRDLILSPISKEAVQLTWKSHPIEGIDYYMIYLYEETELKDERRFNNTAWVTDKMSHFHQNTFTWEKLKQERQYYFTVTACNTHIGCGDPSDKKDVVLRRDPGFPVNITMTCHYDNISMGSYVQVTWEPPTENAQHISEYLVYITAIAHDIDDDGQLVSWQDKPITIMTKELILKVPVIANTDYTVRVCAMVYITAGCDGLSPIDGFTKCSTPPSLPIELPPFVLVKADSSDECRTLKLNMKRVNERRGQIKCYWVVLYKMKNGKLQEIPSPSNINITSYNNVHKEGGYGAYVAEAFNGAAKVRKEVVLGDKDFTQCATRAPMIRKRHVVDDEEEDLKEDVYDGELSPDTYYTGFVEVKVLGKDNRILTKRSNLFPPIRTGSSKNNSSLHATALGIICGLLVVIVILVIALCTLSKRNNFADLDGRSPMNRILCGMFGGSRRTGLMGTPVFPPIDTKPVKPENLPAAFLERHKDSDLQFQREFESLPEQFRDRTTRASDMLENFFKNRYPDIKAYDQTRVKLTSVNGITGSDYINANYVMGYKDRKKFICAQGALEKTINDFWRMIWEQKVEIIIMVTGLEENGKLKCAKYWPDQDEKKYGDITVCTGESNTYADYAIRFFTISHKKDEEIQETREIIQFHYLMWKDFVAPEHPGGILRFIKRINEVHTPDKGPILVHCSAGVGRTGTLVVIDSLLQQMKEDGQVDVFNFVVNIRRQRNFLVQSLKQYIFIYRSLMEHAQFGDTEIEAKALKERWRQLQGQDKGGKSLLQQEFEKLNHVIEDQKSSDIAAIDVNMNKNRHDTLVPYDRNRVILTPVPSRENSAYINASFIQGYNRTTMFIITQDPLECTVGDFWRMVYEQCVPTIVMLSELGETQKCIQYWPEDERDCDHINIKFVQSESACHFTRREFSITNTKNSKSHTVFQLEFHGWSEEVPSKTEGLISLVKQVHETQEEADHIGPAAIHCSGGGDRSSLFAACSIIINQLHMEKRVDVFQTARNLRSQRPFMLQNLAQYKFCYKVALDYSETLSA